MRSRPTHVAEVYVEAEVTDEYGNKVMRPIDTPVNVPGRLQPSTAAESEAMGQVKGTMYRYTSRTFPGGAFARVTVDGRDWDVIGQPKHHTGSPRTEHYTTLLKARS